MWKKEKQSLDNVPKKVSQHDRCISADNFFDHPLTLSVYLFGEDSSYGANQIALILSGCLASIIGLKNGYDWKTIEKGIIDGISLGMGAVLILLAVGALIGTWVMSGTVPAMIYYGLNIMSPSIFYFAACIICALSALSIGSSWTCLLYTSPSPRDGLLSRMPSSA